MKIYRLLTPDNPDMSYSKMIKSDMPDSRIPLPSDIEIPFLPVSSCSGDVFDSRTNVTNHLRYDNSKAA